MTWFGPRTVAFPFTLDPGPLYEATCHEVNYSMSLMLRVARAQETGRTGQVVRVSATTQTPGSKLLGASPWPQGWSP